MDVAVGKQHARFNEVEDGTRDYALYQLRFGLDLARDITRDQFEMLMAKREDDTHFAASDRPVGTQSSQICVDVRNRARVERDFLSLGD